MQNWEGVFLKVAEIGIKQKFKQRVSFKEYLGQWEIHTNY